MRERISQNPESPTFFDGTAWLTKFYTYKSSRMVNNPDGWVKDINSCSEVDIEEFVRGEKIQRSKYQYQFPLDKLLAMVDSWM